ncbi:hypothetical protein BKA83DRAFT_43203, partial [Pisolithus microcarpus]
TVISGSTTLHLALPEQGTPWSPQDLDIYVPWKMSTLMLNRLKLEEDISQVHYSDSTIKAVVIIAKGKRRINLIVSKTSTALSLIFQFHSTVVMNFISANTFFCCYPSLTFQGLTML